MERSIRWLLAPALGLRTHFPGYLPGIALLWLAAEGASPALRHPGAREAAPVAFGLLLLPLLVRPAASALGEEAHAHRSLLALGSSALCGLALFGLLAMAPVPVLVGHFAGALLLGIPPTSPGLVVSAGAVSAAVMAWIMARLWPVLFITYLYPGRETRAPGSGLPSREWIWSGPSFGTAWRMTGQPGALVGTTLPWAAVTALPLGGAVALRLAWSGGPPAVLAQALLYGLALPFTATASVALARGIRVPWRHFDPARGTPLPPAPRQPRRPRPVYLPFPAGAVSGRTPLEPGGAGQLFAYCSNRNQCTHLFPPRPVDPSLLAELSRVFVPGYATLFVLEKCRDLGPAGDGAEPAELTGPVGLAGGEAFCVFRDPQTVTRGSGAVVSRHAGAGEACAAALRHRRESGVAVLVARIVEEVPWH